MANRFFIAVPLSAEIRSALGELQQGIVSRLPSPLLRPVPPRNLHLTLHFLGNQPNADPIVEALHAVSTNRFEVVVAGSGYFPSVRRPRVFWVGVSDPSESLAAVHAELAEALRRRDLPVEKRGFHPHVTLGYVRKGIRSAEVRTLTSATRPLIDVRIGTCTADRILVLNSRTGPGGSTYIEIARLLLR